MGQPGARNPAHAPRSPPQLSGAFAAAARGVAFWPPCLPHPSERGFSGVLRARAIVGAVWLSVIDSPYGFGWQRPA